MSSGEPSCCSSPSRMTATRSAIVIASAWSCVTYRVVVARRVCRRLISPRIVVRSLASRFESGSSMRNTEGSRTIARASATRWRWPPERFFGRRSSRCAISSDSATPSTWVLRSALLEPADAQRVADVLGDRHVRVERVALEDHRDVAVAGLHAGDVAIADEDLARRRQLEAGEDAQRRRLAAARGPEQDEEGAVRARRGRASGAPAPAGRSASRPPCRRRRSSIAPARRGRLAHDQLAAHELAALDEASLGRRQRAAARSRARRSSRRPGARS